MKIRLGWYAWVNIIAVPMGAWAAPTIRPGGIVNAASFRPVTIPGEGLAPGSLATIFGSGLGPTAPLIANSFPLPANLGGVSIAVLQGGRSLNAFPVFVKADQVNFILPSAVSPGTAQIRLSYNNESSAAIDVPFVSSAFGLFTFQQDISRAVVQNAIVGEAPVLNLPTSPARPGQTLIAYGTGLGAITGADNVAPSVQDLNRGQVSVLIGGRTARILYAGRSPCCAGLDQIVFEIPADLPAGCATPLAIRSGVGANLSNISVSIDGAKCSERNDGLFTERCFDGNYGHLFFSDYFAESTIVSGTPFKIESSRVTAEFAGLKGCALYPAFPVESCSVSIQTGSAAGGLPTPTPEPPRITITPLDAGPSLNLSGPSSSLQLVRQGLAYVGLAPGNTTFAQGQYTLSSAGGRDIGAFSETFGFSPLRIQSPELGSRIDATSPLRISWSGGQENSDSTQIALGVSTQAYSASVSCWVSDGKAGSFQFPSWVWSQLPSLRGGVANISIQRYSYGYGAAYRVPSAVLNGGITVGFITIHGRQFQFAP